MWAFKYKFRDYLRLFFIIVQVDNCLENGVDLMATVRSF
jgi:hypothetical protein